MSMVRSSVILLVWLVLCWFGASAMSATLVVEPVATVVGDGGKAQLQAIYDADGSGPGLHQYLDPSLVDFQSNRPLIAGVDAQGQVFGRRAGAATISATYQGLMAKSVVTVAGTSDAYSLETADGRTRSYTLYRPANVPNKAPLVIVYHGGFGSGQGIADRSQWVPVAHEAKTYVAFPEGTGLGTWNVGPCCGYAAEHGVDDVGFASVLIDDIKARVSIDLKKVYATGLSNGAMLAHRLACQLTSKIAAVAAVSGGLNLGGDFPACVPSRPIGVAMYHGTSDDNYPYHGGIGPDSPSGLDYYPIVDTASDPLRPDTVDDWLVKNGLPASSRIVSYEQGIVTCERYSGTNGVEVELCTARPPAKVKVGGVIYDGGGHAWPGGTRGLSAEADVPTQDVIASQRMWEFFMRHALP